MAEVSSYSSSLCPGFTRRVRVCVCVCVYVCVCLGPLAGAVGGLLDGVADPGGIAAAVELHGAPLQPRLPTALTEASIRVDVVVVDAGGWTLSVT